MATFTFREPFAETFIGTDGNDLFIGSNNFFGAGDRAFGGGGIDELLIFIDGSVTNDGAAKANPFFAGSTKTYSAFQLESVEVVTVINDSGSTVIFDMSGSTGVTDLVSANSSSAIIFDQVTNLANVRINNSTFAVTADVGVGFQASALAGPTTLNLVLQNTNADHVRIGESGATLGNIGNSGVETVNLSIIGNTTSSIRLLDTQLTNLVILDQPGSSGGVVITEALAGTVRSVNNQSDGGATINASAATGAVTFTGAGGNENFTGGAFNDIFNLGNGDNVARTGGGDNTVNTGTGNDTVFAQGARDTVNVGDGNNAVVDTTGTWLRLTAGNGSDSYIGIGGNFNASAGLAFDNLDMGGGFDVLFIDAGSTDANFAQVRNAEGIALVTAGTTVLGANAQAAGVNSIFLGSGSAGNDVVNASAFTTGLSVTSSTSDSAADAATLATLAGRVARFNAINNNGGGNDTVTTGSAVDFFLWRGDNALTDADVLRAGGQTNAGGAVLGDTLVLEGDTTLLGGGSFAEFEVVLLESAVGSLSRTQAPSNTFGNQYDLTITNANAPSVGSLFINGSNLKGAVAGQNAAETVIINAAGVTAFGMDITTGAANDVITLGTQSSRVSTGDGNDTVTSGAGNDVIDVGRGNDIVNLTSGNNTVFSEAGNNTITLGTGNDTIRTGGGNDTIIATTANLNNLDSLLDGGGFDTIRISGATVTDANFAGVNNVGNFLGYEVLSLVDVTTATLAANAAKAGFTHIVANAGSNTVINLNNAAFNKGMLVDISAGGNQTVNLGSPTAIAAPSTSVPTPAGLFDFIAQGTEDRTSNANLVIAGVGNQTINGGSGSDVVRINGNEWDALDVFAGGAGYDAIQFDNSAAAVTATINLDNVTNVELFQTLASGLGAGVNNSTITFINGNIGSVQNLKLDNSIMSDASDSMTYVINTPDADFGFTIFGAAAGTTIVSKINFGVNNNINFQGGAGVDILRITGSDLGATTIFNGGAGLDRIVQLQGDVSLITDDAFLQVSNVEILTADGARLNAILGTAAAASGMTTVTGTTFSDVVVFDAGFTKNVSVNLGGAGDDTFNGAASSATFTFNALLTEITAADMIRGGLNGADVFNINATGGGTANLTNVDGIEIYNITANGGDTVTLVLGNVGPTTVNGTQTFNFMNALAGNFDVVISGSTENANTIVNSLGGNDRITLGDGNDIINSGAGNDSIFTGNGTNTVNAGAGNDQVTGGNGNDTIDGGDGNDMLRGGAGNDTIFGGAGDDVIYGGAGADFLSGGPGADQYLYRTDNNSESSFGARDTVVFGTGDKFVFDGAVGVTFVGTAANFQDAQSMVNAGAGTRQAVYQADLGILWIDINDDGTLNNNDMQMLIQFEVGFTGFSAANFANVGDMGVPLSINAWEASFTAAV